MIACHAKQSHEMQSHIHSLIIKKTGLTISKNDMSRKSVICDPDIRLHLFPSIWLFLLHFRPSVGLLLALHLSTYPKRKKKKSTSKINVLSFWLSKGIKGQLLRTTSYMAKEVALFSLLEELLHACVCVCVKR